MSIPSQTYIRFMNPATGGAAIPIVNAVTYNLLTGTNIDLAAGVWAIVFEGEISNPTAGDITLTNLTLNLQAPGSTNVVYNDNLAAFGMVMPNNVGAYYFTKTYTLPVSQPSHSIQFSLRPQVSGAGLLIAYVVYAIRLL